MKISPFLRAFKLLLSLLLIMGNTLVQTIVEPIKPFEPPAYDFDKPVLEMMALSENGQTDYVIVHASNSAPSEKYAAEILQDYLRQICGLTIPIVEDDRAEGLYEIIVGKTNREPYAGFSIDREDLGDEGFVIKTLGSKLIIAGGQKRGTLYGVFSFLEEALGCRWFTSTLIEIPKLNDLKIPKMLDVKQKPYFEYRETDWISPKDKTYSLANKQNGNVYRVFSQKEGGNMGYAGLFAHTLAVEYVDPEKYFESNPEYFALGVRTGQRTSEQLCLTNPDVLSIVIAEVRQTLANNPNAQIVSLTQADNQNYCACKTCKALDKHEGSSAGSMIHFVNAVADALKGEYPNVLFDTFAFQYTRTPPKHVKPHDNVIVRLCSIECCFAHNLNSNSITCKHNAEFKKDLEAWKKICKRLYIWDYTTNYAHFLGPFNNFGVLQENIQFFAENNVKGIYEEGNYIAEVSNGEFAELRAYLLCKLLWNPYIDYNAEMNKFLRAYYGKGWQYVREYIDMTVKHSGKCGNHMRIFDEMDEGGTLLLSAKEIAYCNDLWQKAALLAEDEESYNNVLRSELAWRYWKAQNKRDEFSRIKNYDSWKDEHEALYNDYKKHGISLIRHGQYFSQNPDFSKLPGRWYD